MRKLAVAAMVLGALMLGVGVTLDWIEGSRVSSLCSVELHGVRAGDGPCYQPDVADCGTSESCYDECYQEAGEWFCKNTLSVLAFGYDHYKNADEGYSELSDPTEQQCERCAFCECELHGWEYECWSQGPGWYCGATGWSRTPEGDPCYY